MRKKKIVTIGGGTGSFTVLSGLREYDYEISAIVSMADDGGSTGRLRDELGVLPPGDIRQCLVALSEKSQSMRDLFNYRFESGQLKGHSVGNLFLSASEKMTGKFSEGLKLVNETFNIKGKVLPVTDSNTNLQVKLENGTTLKGENEINHNNQIQRIGVEKIYLEPSAEANLDALEAIKKADMIIIGPGNHYCSIIPNLVVKKITQAIEVSRAKVVYVCNLVNKKGHTDNFTLDDYADSINSFFKKERIDMVIYNSRHPAPKLKEKYEKKGEKIIKFNKKDREGRNYQVIITNILSGRESKYSQADAIAATRSLIRHDSNKLAQVVDYLLKIDSYKNIIKKIQ